MYLHPIAEAYRGFVSNYARPNLISDGISSITFGENLCPVRKVVSRSNTNGSGKWPSWKMGSVHYESESELLAFKVLDTFPHALSYYPQPCKIKYVEDGQPHIHIPDILVFTRDSVEIWEIKDRYDSLDPEVLKRTDFMTRYLMEIGYTYKLVVGETLNSQPRFDNLEFIIKWGREDLNLQRREFIRQTFQTYKTIKWGIFKNDGSSDFIQRSEICRLLLEGKLSCDLNTPISNTTLVTATASYGGR